jgi:hypothetical protein
MNDRLSDDLLLACGLLYYHGDQLRVSKQQWELFRGEFRLCDVEVTCLTLTALIESRVNVIRIGALGKKTPFHAGEQAECTQKGTMKMKRLRITSQQNDFCGSIARHLMTTKVLEQLVMDAEESEEDKEEDVAFCILCMPYGTPKEEYFTNLQVALDHVKRLWTIDPGLSYTRSFMHL